MRYLNGGATSRNTTLRVLLLLILVLTVMIAVINILAGLAVGMLKEIAMEQDKMVLHLHIHTSGGTTLCKTAKVNEDQVTDNNCNMKGDGPWTITEKTLERTCKEHCQLARERIATLSLQLSDFCSKESWTARTDSFTF